MVKGGYAPGLCCLPAELEPVHGISTLCCLLVQAQSHNVQEPTHLLVAPITLLEGAIQGCPGSFAHHPLLLCSHDLSILVSAMRTPFTPLYPRFHPLHPPCLLCCVLNCSGGTSEILCCMRNGEVLTSREQMYATLVQYLAHAVHPKIHVGAMDLCNYFLCAAEMQGMCLLGVEKRSPTSH